MRIIKFRAWNPELNKMSKPFSFGQILNFWDTNFKSLEPDKEIVMQFTGLLDKNGKEIFEGDIVRWGMHGGSWGHEIWNRYAEVEINPDLQFRIIHYIHSETGEKRPTDNYIFHFGKFAYTETEQFLEIIGNVFENPELLKTVSSKNKA